MSRVAPFDDLQSSRQELQGPFRRAIKAQRVAVNERGKLGRWVGHREVVRRAAARHAPHGAASTGRKPRNPAHGGRRQRRPRERAITSDGGKGRWRVQRQCLLRRRGSGCRAMRLTGRITSSVARMGMTTYGPGCSRRCASRRRRLISIRSDRADKGGDRCDDQQCTRQTNAHTYAPRCRTHGRPRVAGAVPR